MRWCHMAEDKPYLPVFGSHFTETRFKFLHLSFPRSWILLKLAQRRRIEEDLNDLHSTSIILLSIFRELFEIWMPIFGENEDVECNFRSCVKGKMISNPKEKGKVQANQEGETSNYGKLSMASSSARQWLGLRNPRIVRVSRSFGGKDRHSKVCTIRGLRDRRIRLSVPTAIQLYDLQERLGLGQPSKVIDWLLEVTKLDIDELPPLQIPQGFGHFPQQMLVSRDFVNSQSSSIPPFFDSANTSSEFVKGGLEDNDPVRAKSKGKWTSDHTSQDRIADFSTQIGAHNFLLNNSLSENTSSSSLGGGHSLFLPQIEDHHPSEAPFFAPSGSQLFLYPPSTMPTLFTPYPSCITTQVENDPRQFNHFQLLGSSLSVVPTLHSFPKLLISQNNGSQQKDNATGS